MPLILKTITILYITICGFIIGVAIAQAPPPVIIENNITLIPIASPNPVEATIRHYADEYGVDVETSLRIATCESMMGKYKHNWEGSSAYGLYQFMPRTFNAYCKGSIKNDEDQIICFMELYPSKPHWWECK